MAIASRHSDRFRRQVTRDVVLEISSADGARQRYALHAASRRLTLPRRSHDPAECVLRFACAREGLRALLSPRAIGRIVEGMNTGGTRMRGNAALMLWFHGLTRVVMPIGRSRVPRRTVRLARRVPVRGPARAEPYGGRIVREPVERELSRDWPEAWRAREKLLQLRAADGDPLPPG